MLSQGYCKFSRGWKNDQRSPFYGSKHRKYHDVWREICEQAGYCNERGMETGVLKTSLNELSKSLGIPRRSCLNAVRWIAERGLLSVEATKPSLSLLIVRYDDLDCLERYFASAEQPKSRESGTAISSYKNRGEIAFAFLHKTSGTAGTVFNKSESLENKGNLKTIWHSTELSGTHLAHQGEGIMACNDKEKQSSKKPSGTDLAQNPPILKNREDITTLKSSSRRLALRRKPPRQPTDQETQLATFWHQTICKHTRANLIPVEDQVAGVIKVVDETPVDFALLQEVLAWAAGHVYWRKEAKSLLDLLSPYRRQKTVKRLQQMIEEMDTDNQNKKSIASDKPKWVGKYV